ncbi:sigma-70 family RNA polymerase sigma factor (plasmid) [Acinetobacter baumannii]|uniref:sigma-70 family RNA polymerase sigma factor n=1 Tax=Acinetobacter baumannii TaxID=470 RepID=UPI0034670F83
MVRNQDQLFRDHDKLLRHLAHRNISRLTSVGYCIDVEELYAIFCEVFVVSIQTWDESKGKLTTYLTTACLNMVSRLLKKYHLGDNRTEYESDILHRMGDGEDDCDYDVFVDHQSQNILGPYELMQTLTEEMQQLSPFAKILLKFTLNPPDFIERELLAQEAKYQLSLITPEKNESRGPRRRKLNLSFVANCIMKTAETNKEKRFIRDAVKEVEEAVTRVAV